MHHHYRQKEQGNSKHRKLDLIADVNGLIGGLAMLPQVIKVFTTGSIEGLSAITFSIILLNSSIWLYYALVKKIIPLKISSILIIVMSSTLLLLMVFMG